MYQIIIKNGMVIDPGNGLFQQADVAVADGKIAGVGAFEADGTMVVDASGCLVTPGLIDHHCHLYPMAKIGIPAEAMCFPSGVTTAVDAGSTGCATFAEHLPAMEGGKLVMNLGFSHQVIMEVPQGLTVETPSANQIVVSGFDKQLVGQFAANVREKRPPEPYKGKGIKYSDEVIRRKVGKTGVKK